jgi:hypothetical protein
MTKTFAMIRAHQTAWPLWRKILFRFFFIYLGLNIAPWTWLDRIPYVEYLTKYYYQFLNWAVNLSNAKIFHVRKTLVPINGSGDTSWGWTQVCLFLCVAAIGCLLWTMLDRKRRSYTQLNYWLCVFTRYNIALFAFAYGIIKLFALQMPFPSTSMMATSLGDLLPMRLSWMFIGYSSPYQIFSGAMEMLVGVLLLYRRTATFGAILGTAVFTNVMLLNLAYDIPVKIFSIHIVLMCLFLLVNEYKRIVCFFLLNKPADSCTIYNFSFPKRWMRLTRIVLKTLFILVSVGWVFYSSYGWYKEANVVSDPKPLKRGIYDIAVFAVNRDTLPPLLTDTLRWQDLIMDNAVMGTIKTSDTAFRRIYGRAYFRYAWDSKSQFIFFKNFAGDTVARFHCKIPDSSTIILTGKRLSDSLYVVLKRSNRHFQLAERQFHWLSEYNR